MPAIGLAPELVGLIAALILFALGMIATLASHVIPNFPLVGGAIRSGVVSAVKAIASGVGSLIDDSAIPFAFVLQGVALVLWWTAFYAARLVVAIPDKIDATSAYAVHLYHQGIGYTQQVDRDLTAAIGAAEVRAVAAATGLAGLAERDAIGFAKTVQADLTGQVVNTLHAAEHLYNLAVTHADQLVAPIAKELSALEALGLGGLTGAIASLSATLAADEAKVLTDIANAVATAEQAAAGIASGAATGAVAALNLAAHDLVIGPWDALLPAVADIVEHLPADVAQALQLPGLVAGALPATIPGILAAVIPTVAAVATEVDRCIVPMCSTPGFNPSTLGKLVAVLGELADAALWVAFLALLTEAVADPRRAVADLRATVAPVVNETLAGVRELLGV